ncbi:MAG: hypothetical protein EBR86_04625 [Planctomycetia bacterium]|nr:hypothetical protein [Planctomycetia bacterium]
MTGTRWFGVGAVVLGMALCCGCGSSKPAGVVAKSEGSSIPPMRPKGMNRGEQPATAPAGQSPAKAGGPVVAAPIETP